MRKIQLEKCYLAKVLLYFPYMSEVKKFIEINHKCEETAYCLKINPSFHNKPSIEWFWKYFNMETVDFRTMKVSCFEICEEIDLIRNPPLSFFYEKGFLNEQTFQMIFPKISRMYLSNSHSETQRQIVENTNKLIIENSHLFTRLDYLTGDLRLICEFLENFTDNGKELNIKMPKTIILKSCDGYAISWNQKTKEFVERIEKCLPEGTRVQCSIIVYSHPSNKEVLKMFKKINYYYRFIESEQCEKWNDHLYIDSGEICVNGVMKNDKLNEIIERALPLTLLYKMIQIRNQENWTIPECIKHMVLHKNGTYLHQMSNINLDMKNIKTLEIQDCNNQIFGENISFDSLEELEIANSKNITFENSNFKQLKKVIVKKSKNIALFPSEFIDNIDLKILDCVYVKCGTKISQIKSLHVVFSDYVYLQMFSFKDKYIYIENSTITFLEENVRVAKKIESLPETCLNKVLTEIYEYCQNDLKRLVLVDDFEMDVDSVDSDYSGMDENEFMENHNNGYYTGNRNVHVIDELNNDYDDELEDDNNNNNNEDIDNINNENNNVHVISNENDDDEYEFIEYFESEEDNDHDEKNEEINIENIEEEIEIDFNQKYFNTIQLKSKLKTKYQLFEMRKFVPYTFNVDVTENNQIIPIDHSSTILKGLLVSHDFVTPTNVEKYFEFISLINDEQQILSTNKLRYFEIEVEGFSMISIGVVDTLKFEKVKDKHIGWDDNSIGYHGDDGEIHSHKYHFETNVHYAEGVGQRNTVGVGFIIDTNTLFFTCDGVIVKSFDINYIYISAAIAVEKFKPITLNFGERMFKFDLLSLLK